MKRKNQERENEGVSIQIGVDRPYETRKIVMRVGIYTGRIMVIIK